MFEFQPGVVSDDHGKADDMHYVQGTGVDGVDDSMTVNDINLSLSGHPKTCR